MLLKFTDLYPANSYKPPSFVDGFEEWDLLGFGLKQGRNEAPFLHLYSLYGLYVKYMAKLQYAKSPLINKLGSVKSKLV